ncbi:MAG: (Fe-S)-binding protein [Hyphomonadaceae bacterium]
MSEAQTAPPAKDAKDLNDAEFAAATNKFLALIGADIAAYAEACVRCGQCAEACHFHEASGDPKHTPAYKLVPIAKAHRRAHSPLGWLGLAPQVSRDDLAHWEELIFDTCTMCGRCTIVCPMAIDVSSMVAATRQAFAAAGLGPADLRAAADNSRDRGSPLGVTAEVLRDRIEWLSDDNDVPIPLDKEKADVLLTISSIEMMKYPQSVVAMAKLMNAAGANWTFSSEGYESTNFGFLSGRPDIAKTMVERMAKAAEKVGAKILVIPECGHAFGVMRWSGANILGRTLPFAVLHITEYLAQLKREGKLKFNPYDAKVTYHDPCQISRRGGATQDARDLLDGFATNFREMTPAGNLNWCCGGGGGVQAMARAADLRHKVFQIKMDQVAKSGADVMVSSCANCRLTMDESAGHWHWDKKLESLIEVLADHVIEQGTTP